MSGRPLTRSQSRAAAAAAASGAAPSPADIQRYQDELDYIVEDFRARIANFPTLGTREILENRRNRNITDLMTSYGIHSNLDTEIRAAESRIEIKNNRRIVEENQRASEREARALRSFGSTGAVAAMTNQALTSIRSAQMERITSLLSNRLRHNNLQRPDMPTAARNRQEAYRVFGEKISSLFNVSNEIARYLNAEQLSYFTQDSFESDYYYRKLELLYKIPTIDKFNQLCDNLSDNITSTTSISSNNRIDADYYYDIVYYLNEINKEIKLLIDPNEISNALISDIMNKISNEKNTITSLKNRLIQLRSADDPTLNQNIDYLVRNLTIREDKISKITRPKLYDLFEDDKFKKMKKYCIYILSAVKILCKIMLLLIIKLYYNQRSSQPNSITYETIISYTYESLYIFSYIINIPYSDNFDEFEYLNTLFTEVSLLLHTNDDNRQQIIVAYNAEFPIEYEYELLQRHVLPPQSGLSLELTTIPPTFDNPQQQQQQQRRAAARAPARAPARAATRAATTAAARDTARAAAQAARTQAQAARAAAQAARAQAAAERAAARAAARATQSARIAARAQAARQVPSSVSSRFGNMHLNSSSSSDNSGSSSDDDQSAVANTSLTTTEIDQKFIIDANAEQNYDSTYLSSVANSFKGPDNLLVKLKDKYIEYSKNIKSSSDKKILFDDIKSKFKLKFNNAPRTARIASIDNFVGNSIASLFGRYLQNTNDMKFNDLAKYFVINFALEEEIVSGTNNKIYKKVRQPGIDVGGLRRDFITALTTELFQKEIFITMDGTKKYFLNPNFLPNDEFKWIVENISGTTINISTNDFLKTFYNFIGNLLSFILVNDCGIEHNLSSYIMANFHYTDNTVIDDLDYVNYTIADFPEFINTITNLMADPANIENAFIGLNDYYQLQGEYGDDINLTDQNIETYIMLVSKFMMTATPLRKDIELKGANLSTSITETNYNLIVNKAKKILLHLIEGIPSDIKSYFKKYPIKALNSFLVTPTMSNEIINKLKANFTLAMGKRNSTKIGDNKALHEKLTRLFISHVLTRGSHMGSDDNEENFFKFIDKLLKFWSASSFYKENEEYKIQINTLLSTNHFPQSHTCFFTIDLPNYADPSTQSDNDIGQKLYEKIKGAINNVSAGMDLAGGSRRRSSRRN
jgi:hypothetical protein